MKNTCYIGAVQWYFMVGSYQSFFLSSRYIRLVGTHNTVNRIFHVVHFECMFSSGQHTLGENNVLGMLIITISHNL